MILIGRPHDRAPPTNGCCASSATTADQSRTPVTGRAYAQCPGHDDPDVSLIITGIEGHDPVALPGTHGSGMPTRSGDGRHGPRPRRPVRRPHREPTTAIPAAASCTHANWTPTTRNSCSPETRTTTSLYRADRLTDDTQTIYVPEGEKDVHAIEWAGATAVTSPQGAKSAHKFDWSPLKGHDVIIVVDLHRGARWLVG